MTPRLLQKYFKRRYNATLKLIEMLLYMRPFILIL